MAPESMESKIEKLIIETLTDKSPIPEEDLVQIVVRKFGNGDILNKISQVIAHMEHNKYTLIRTLDQHSLELNLRKNRR